MNWLTIKRILRAGVLSFSRNAFVSFASILVMTVTLFTVGTTIFAGVILNSALIELRDKADVNVYFTTNAPEDQILQMKTSLEALPEVASVEAVREELRRLGYLDSGLDRFVLAGAGAPSPLRACARAALRVGLAGGVLFGLAGTVGGANNKTAVKKIYMPKKGDSAEILKGSTAEIVAQLVTKIKELGLL